MFASSANAFLPTNFVSLDYSYVMLVIFTAKMPTFIMCFFYAQNILFAEWLELICAYFFSPTRFVAKVQSRFSPDTNLKISESFQCYHRSHQTSNSHQAEMNFFFFLSLNVVAATKNGKLFFSFEIFLHFKFRAEAHRHRIYFDRFVILRYRATDTRRIHTHTHIPYFA